MTEEKVKYTTNDFKSDQEVRWCAGCGDHVILNSVQRAFAESGLKKEDFVVVSGIGCSSRFPYYMSTYGVHSLHGRANAIASGVKCANPKLKVVVVTGDGDSMAIGGNHYIHLIRRNIDMTVLMFNNEIYGLTKGQYSPTTKIGTITKTSPFGTIEHPFLPGELVIGAQGKFFARTIDSNLQQTTSIIQESLKYKGTSVVEILQNCVIYNDKAHAVVSDKQFKDERQLWLEHGKPMLFGKNKEKGLMLGEGFKLKVVTIGENGVTLDNILVHDAKEPQPFIHLMLVNMNQPEFPVALGIIRAVDTYTYDDLMTQQIEDVKKSSKIKTMTELLNSGDTWIVE
jgi:2-oxoglutarate ferredoxin oxidoreductase subunit beta